MILEKRVAGVHVRLRRPKEVDGWWGKGQNKEKAKREKERKVKKF